MSTQIVENLIQGVSQQGAQNRRLTQCEAQWDCLNQPVEGCVPRPGFELVKKLYSGSYPGLYNAPVFRDKDERYQVFVSGGVLRVFNLRDGSEATIAMQPGATAYLAATGIARDVFSVAAAEDVIFVLNKEKVPVMGTAKSPARPKEALFYFKAGSYLTTYVISITWQNVVYQWQYQTPDNSVTANAQHITTSAICYALYNAMVVDPNGPTSKGFNMQRSGSIMRIWRTDGAEFSIDVQDGQGNAQLLGFKDTVGGFEKLPQSGFSGMVFKVLGDAKSDADDYYVEYTGGTSTGVWEETIKPDTPITLDPASMPFTLINTGYNTFTFGPAPWGNRIAGDEKSAKVPSFVGKRLAEVAFDNARLLLITPGAAIWSRTKNPYVFFPDTVQAKLATAPIDYDVKASKQIAILDTVLQTDDATFLWAENRQFKVSTADQAFTGENVAIKPSSSYEFNENIAPVPVGASVLFGHDNGPWSGVTDLEYRDGNPLGTTVLTDHAPKYVPKNLQWITATDIGKKAVMFSPETPTQLYVYEWHYSERRRVQSSWQTWRLPPDCSIIWGVFDRSDFYLTVQRPDGAYLLKLSFAPYQVDPSAGAQYLTRLDMRIDDTKVTRTWNATTLRTRIALPFLVSDPANYRVVTRETYDDAGPAGPTSRGTTVPIESWANEGGVSVAYAIGNWMPHKLYIGRRISAERIEGQFFERDQDGAYVHNERVNVSTYTLAHSDSAYYRIEKVRPVTYEVMAMQEMTGRFSGDVTNVFGAPVLHTGSTELPITDDNDAFRVRLVNDSFLPSAWQSAVWEYSGMQ